MELGDVKFAQPYANKAAYYLASHGMLRRHMIYEFTQPFGELEEKMNFSMRYLQEDKEDQEEHDENDN